ncbi:MAG: DUF4321 domain-containing protein [Candidatus Marinimicrobia bacterium]|nr:DUF4321 domain-containing protein [Candidatus Neomarinimicrobiota bacterium]
MTKRNLALIFIILMVGAMFGTLFGQILGWMLPESVVRDFFLLSVDFSLGGLVGSETGVINLNLGFLAIQFGLSLTINFTTLIGLATAYYFLRYFR